VAKREEEKVEFVIGPAGAGYDDTKCHAFGHELLMEEPFGANGPRPTIESGRRGNGGSAAGVPIRKGEILGRLAKDVRVEELGSPGRGGESALGIGSLGAEHSLHQVARGPRGIVTPGLQCIANGAGW
jgi:hypothetical protein